MHELNKNNNFLSICAHGLIGLGLLNIHVFHLSSVFERETNFSQLSSIEKESIFKSDHALYYSSFKTLVEADNFTQGMHQLINNNLIEYPASVNAIKKFHIFPEIVIGFLYKQFMAISDHFGLDIFSSECWMSTNKQSVDSAFLDCNTIGDPIYFYLQAVWFMGGLTIFLLYFYATFLSRNIFGGITAAAYYFSIHNDSTQIHRYPAARENFAFVFILWQMLYLTMCIDKHRMIHNEKSSVQINRNGILMITNLMFLSILANLCWQFTSFIFSIQTFIMFIVLLFNMIKVGFFVEYAIAQVLANTISCFLMYDNRHFVFSFQQPTLIVTFLIILQSKKFIKSSAETPPQNDTNKTLREKLSQWFYNNIPTFIALFGLACEITERMHMHNDDVNIIYWDILMTKLHFKPTTLTTLLYLCGNQLSFIDIETVKTYNKVFFGKFFGVFIVIYMSKWLQARRLNIEETSADRIERSKNYLIEDFLEENKISMADLLNADTDKQIKKLLNDLEKCGYDYELYKQKKIEKIKPKRNEKEAFLNDVKRFKEQINEIETAFVDGTKLTKQQFPTEKSSSVRSETNELLNDELNNDTVDEKSSSSSSANENLGNSDTENINKNTENNDTDENTNDKTLLINHPIRPYYFYNVLQTFVFLIMTCFVVRLKYLLTPFMCLMASSFPPRSWFPRTQNLYWIVYVCSVIFSAADTGIQNLQQQYAEKEIPNQDVAQLMQWIMLNTEQTAVFAGPSNIITTVMLTTRRPIVNHPRNEYHNMRYRTKLVYSVLSKQPYSEIYRQLAKLKVQYVILSYKDCYSMDSNCKLANIWDSSQPEYRDNIQFCAELFQKKVSNFIKVFVSEKYLILKLFSRSVELELKNLNLKEVNM